MRPILIPIALVLLTASAGWTAEPVVLTLWPDQPPGETAKLPPESEVATKPGQRPVKRITNVAKPTLSVFKPSKERDTGAAVVIAPGGGYNILAWDLEGEEVAAWLNSIGITGIVLKYRVPRRPAEPRDKPPLGALQDGQRAISLVRSRATELGIDPNRLGLLGFSAGGHLTAWVSTNFDRRAYEPVDEIDKVSCRPDFAVLVYPGYLVERGKPDALAADIRVTEKTPPCFFAHAYDDGVTPENSVRMFLELKKVKVPAELHVYSTGGHGYGLRPEGKPVATWPARCEDWLKMQGVIGKK